ncbi:MAG: methylmalonyl-CoA carboxyltransferase [Actinomycetota bacterium]|nr:methylmalonyl-CoA carboxyltransferase [Actinomycetota bacterium]
MLHLDGGGSLPIAAGASTAASACLRRFDERQVAFFRLEGGKHRGAIGPPEGIVLERIVARAVEFGLPLVGVLSTSGADIHEGVASLHAWGRVARSVAQASGVVPIVLAVIGPCTSGPALLLGVADHVVMTPDAFAYVSGPEAVAEFTGVGIDRLTLGGGAVHDSRTGVASLVAADEDDALLAVADLLAYLPSHHLQDPPAEVTHDPLDRLCRRAAEAVPDAGRASYDVRTVVADVLDAVTFLEVRARYAPNMVTGYARLGGRAVAVVANQPQERAGTLDIEASRKAARFVQCADAFNTPILTFVDTPGFEPGKDLEWRGMIRHGAELVHAYAAATVPRVCVVLRKAYGGAYIVMDSKGLGNDACFAWPGAEIAVMGAKGAVQVLYGKRLAATATGGERGMVRAGLESDYDARFCTPVLAAERGLVDDIIDPLDTRRVLGGALAGLASKRERHPTRKHTISPC